MRPKYPGGAAVAFLLTAASPAMAQMAQNDHAAAPAGSLASVEIASADSDQADIVVTAQKLRTIAGGQVARGATLGVFGDRDLFDTPVSTKSFTSDYIADIGALNATEIASHDASFSIINSAALNGATSGRLRGFRIEPFESTVDGLSTIASRRYSLEFVERVDLLKGPSAIYTGLVGGVGGTINYITKKPLDAPLTRITAIFDGRSDLGGYADVSRRFGAGDAFGLRANLSYRDGETSIVDTRQRNSVVHVAFNARLADATTLDLQYGSSYTHVRGGSSGYFFADGVPIGRPPQASSVAGPDWDERTTHDQFIRGQLNVGIAKGWSLFAAGSLANPSERFVGLTPAVIAADGTATAFSFAQQGRTDWGDGYSIDTGVRGKFDTGSIRHSITAIGSYAYGLQRYTDLTIDPAFVPPTFNIYRPRSQNGPAPVLTGGRDYFPLVKSITQGFVLADELAFLDGRLLATVAIRYTALRTDSFNYAAPTAPEDVGKYRSHNWSPALALLFKVVPNVSVYANYLKAVEAGQIAFAPAVNAGEIIPPSISRQYETGIKADFGRFGVSAALFDIERPSIYIDTATQRLGNFGRQRHRGFEADLFGTPIAGVRLLASYTHLDAKLLRNENPAIDGNRPVSVPKDVLVAGFDADVPRLRGAAVLGNVRVQGNQTYDVTNSRSIPGFTVFDAGLRYNFSLAGTPLKARLNITNLFNRSFWQSSDFTVQTGDPRTVRLTIEAAF